MVIVKASKQLEGSSLSRYHPCGLGMISFTKHVKGTWEAELNLKHYRNLTTSDEVEVIIRFKENPYVYVYAGSHNNITFTMSDKKMLVIAAGVLAHKSTAILFYVKLDDSNVLIINEVIVNNDSICNSDMKTSQIILYSPPSEGTPAWQYQPKCGRKWPDREEWLTVRSEAGPGDWPWHVAIYLNDAFRCGGTIVSNIAVITVDGCITKNAQIEKIMVVAGTSNLTDMSQSGRQQLNVSEIIKYPGHDTRPDNVYVLLIIKLKPFEFSKYVQPICLFAVPASDTDIIINEAIFVGYGKTQAHQTYDVLRSTELVMTGSNCRKRYPLFIEFNFCVGMKPLSDDKLTKGDGGGGLVMSTIEQDQRMTWYLRGVLAKGKSQKPFASNQSLLFIDVTPFYTWILLHSGL